MNDNVRFLPAAGADHEGTVVGLLSGHVCRVYEVSPVDGERGTVIPQRFRKAAIAAGCGIVGLEDSEPDTGDKQDKQSLLVAAIERIIEADDPNSLDGNGRPKLANLKKEAGMGVTKSEADAAWAAFVADLDE